MDLVKSALNSKSFKEFDTIFNNGKMVHAYLVIGADLESNKAFCTTLTLKLCCQNHLPCLNCDNCKKILSGFHPDVLIYPKGKNFVVTDSESILENANIKPMESDYKVFVINSIDSSTVQAQNKLLKTVEESPQNVVFIFNAINEDNVLQTIKSRTQEIYIDNFNQHKLEEKNDFNFLVDLINNLKSSKQIIQYIAKFSDKSNFEDRLNTFAELFETMLYEKTSNNYQFFASVADEYPFNAITEILQLITLAKKQYKANVSTNLITDNLLLKILEAKFLWNKK